MKILMKKKSRDFLNFIKEKENKYGKISFMENNFRGKRTTNDRFFKSIDLVLYGMYSIFNFSWAKKITIINKKMLFIYRFQKLKHSSIKDIFIKLNFLLCIYDAACKTG